MINYQLNNQKKTRASQAEGHEFEPRLPLIMKALIVNRLAIEVFCF